MFQDVGGQDALRQFWRHHFTGIQVLIMFSLELTNVQLGGHFCRRQLGSRSVNKGLQRIRNGSLG